MWGADNKKYWCVQLYDAEAECGVRFLKVLKLKGPPDMQHNAWQFSASSLCSLPSLSLRALLGGKENVRERYRIA